MTTSSVVLTQNIQQNTMTRELALRQCVSNSQQQQQQQSISSSQQQAALHTHTHVRYNTTVDAH